MLFDFDYCLCGNPDNCPHKHECKRAIKIVGIYTSSNFYKEGKECEYFWKKDDKKEAD